MALAPSTNLVFAGVKKKWDSENLDSIVSGGSHRDESPERKAKPYAVVDAIADVHSSRTNIGKYRIVLFSITLITNTPEQGGEMAGSIYEAFEDVDDLEIDGARVVELVTGPVRYLWDKQQQVLKTILEFKALLARPRIR